MLPIDLLNTINTKIPQPKEIKSIKNTSSSLKNQNYLRRNTIKIVKPIFKHKQTTSFWKETNGNIKFVFGKDDFPDILKKKVRLKNIIKKNIEKKEEIVRKRYVINHPVVKLLERNANRLHVNEALLDVQALNELKQLHGLSNSPPIHERKLIEQGVLKSGYS